MKPNILLIHADQHRADCLGINGHPFVQTPYLDQLGRDGINFTQAFCPIPLCSPSRTSLLTGLWPTQHGCIANADTEAFRPLLAGLPTFSQTLKAAGYFLACIGKWGVDPGKPPNAYGFDAYIAERDYLAWRKEQGVAPRPFRNRWFGETDPYIQPEQSQVAWSAGVVCDLLHEASGRQTPFFLQWNPSEPHLPNIVPEPYASLYPPQTIPPWPSFPDTMHNKPYIQRQQKVTWGIEEWGWQEWAPIVGRYLGEITLLDQQIGRVLATLELLGLADQTLVVYTVDHGDLCGGHGLIDKHYVMYDELVRVPLLMRWPGRIEPGQTSEDFVCSAIDLASTFCDAAAVPTPSTFMGRSLLPPPSPSSSENEVQPAEEEVKHDRRPDIFATYHGNQFGLYSQRMVRDRRWKYIWNATAEDELYDLLNDPGELTNLAANRDYADELQRLRLRLVAWMQETKDRLLNEWTKNQLLKNQKL